MYFCQKRSAVRVNLLSEMWYNGMKKPPRRRPEGMNDMKNKTTLYIANGAMIAAIYVVLTLLLAPISYGAMQVRISEALCILPMFTSAAIPGLFVGCLLANLLGGAVIWDVIFGSLATLIGAAGGYLLRKNRWLVPIPSVAANVVIIPLVLKYGYGVDMALPLLAAYLAAGESIGCYVLGEILCSALKRLKPFK